MKSFNWPRNRPDRPVAKVLWQTRERKGHVCATMAAMNQYDLHICHYYCSMLCMLRCLEWPQWGGGGIERLQSHIHSALSMLLGEEGRSVLNFLPNITVYALSNCSADFVQVELNVLVQRTPKGSSLRKCSSENISAFRAVGPSH